MNFSLFPSPTEEKKHSFSPLIPYTLKISEGNHGSDKKSLPEILMKITKMKTLLESRIWRKDLMMESMVGLEIHEDGAKRCKRRYDLSFSDDHRSQPFRVSMSKRPVGLDVSTGLLVAEKV
ncbi:hypothetical protein CRG98_031829 [Punica granatum]|uniref:Uncharacterized protein n=1 Tax=Punica granatum TaxID=22663 RepID=A0A2I0IUW6_PUNGR|nr:hypothetical protein CRG98_031829 [Punica granatum]